MLGIDGVEKVSADFFTRKIAPAEACERHFRDGHGHQSLLNGSCDREFLLVAARTLLPPAQGARSR